MFRCLRHWRWVFPCWPDAEGCEGGFVPFNRGSLPVVSGIAMEVKEDSGRAMESGMNGFLSKPIVIGDLVQELHKIL